MTLKTCPNCGKTFKRTEHYNNHVNPNRKFPCIAPKIDVAPICTKITPNCTKITPNSEEFEPKSLNNNLICLHCNKSFTRPSSLNRHLEGRCKNVPNRIQKGGNNDVESLIKIVENQNKKIEELEKKIHLVEEKNVGDTINNNNCGTVNNGTINNNNNNIVIVAYGDEKNKLDPKIICDAILAGNDCIPKYIESIHFNPNYPENHNIYKPKKSEPYVNVRMPDNTWELQDSKTIVQSMIVNSSINLQKEINTNENVKKEMKKFKLKTLTNTCSNHLNDIRGIPNSDSEDELQNMRPYKRTKAEEATKTVENKLNLLLYNKRDIVKDTKEKEDRQEKMKKKTRKSIKNT